MFKIKLVSSQVKVFLDDKIDSFTECKRITALGGEVVSFQVLYVDEGPKYITARPYTKVTLSGELSRYATARDVRIVPVDRPVKPDRFDDQYLRTTPGVYPDLLTPLRYGGKVCPSRDKLRSVWVDVEVPKDCSGVSELSLTFDVEAPTQVFAAEASGEEVKDKRNDGQLHQTVSVTLDVIAAQLPEDELMFTQWFYPDCIASYYNVEAFSDRHFEIMESFISLAVKRGRNVMYTALLTPFLNVNEPFYRNPAQLVGISVEDGKYSFDFTNVDRFVDMCDRCGVKFFEISHFFQQHSVEHAAHVYATVSGEVKRIFGWETAGNDPKYIAFLRELLSAFIAHMKKRGDDRRCIFHISDEPTLKTLEAYKAAKDSIGDLIEGYKTIDALSDFDFYERGLLKNPVPTTTASAPFIKAGVPDLWVYYACCELVNYSNCYVAMPSWRTRSLGFQLYKHENITGFLHWGYNYYNNRSSGDAIDPYIDLSGEDWVPAGDTFMVYPSRDGTPLESIRMLSITEALQDWRAMKLAEKYYSHDEVVAAIEAVLGEPITFERCAHSEAEMLAIRAAVDDMIRAAIAR